MVLVGLNWGPPQWGWVKVIIKRKVRLILGLLLILILILSLLSSSSVSFLPGARQIPYILLFELTQVLSKNVARSVDCNLLPLKCLCRQSVSSAVMNDVWSVCTKLYAGIHSHDATVMSSASMIFSEWSYHWPDIDRLNLLSTNLGRSWWWEWQLAIGYTIL